MIRREFLKKAVVTASAMAAGTIVVPKVAAKLNVSTPYITGRSLVLKRLLELHEFGLLDEVVNIKKTYRDIWIDYNFGRGGICILDIQKDAELTCLDYRDIVNLLYEKTGVAYGIQAKVDYIDYKEYQKIVYNCPYTTGPYDEDCSICLIFRHGQKEEMTMFSRELSAKNFGINVAPQVK